MWWFPPPRVHLEAHDKIQPVALLEELEYSEGLPDYSNVPHGSTVEVIAVPVIEVFYGQDNEQCCDFKYLY